MIQKIKLSLTFFNIEQKLNWRTFFSLKVTKVYTFINDKSIRLQMILFVGDWLIFIKKSSSEKLKNPADSFRQATKWDDEAMQLSR